MTKQSLRIVFMGTPAFAIESLKKIGEEGYHVVGVVTAPDKPAGRGYQIQYSPVKKFALANNLPLLQPEKLKDPAFLNDLKDWKADVQIVIAFRMLPEIVWNMPPLGTINLHASLLPQYRGAAPINWAIIHGEKETGVTTFFITHEIDTGKIIFQEKIPILENDNAGSLHDKLMVSGASLVIQTLDQLLSGTIQTIPQEELILLHNEIKTAPKILKDTCQIDWNQDVKQVHNFIRGLSPYPTAWTKLKNTKDITHYIKVFESAIQETMHHIPCGTVQSDGKTFIEVAVKNGFIRLINLQQEGRKRMGVEEFLRGGNWS